MKTDFITAIVAAIIGVAVSYLVVGNVIWSDPKPITIKTLEGVDPTVSEPNPEIFNYRAINPTVETYIDCTNYDLSGNCLEPENQED